MNKLDHLKNIFAFIKDVLFPTKCMNCGEFVDASGICSRCWMQITWISDPKCKICGTPFDTDMYDICHACLERKLSFDRAIAVFEYDDFSKNIIIKFKHNDMTYVAKQLARWIYRVCESHLNLIDIIVPVPISFLKRLKRKYNQSELLSLELSALTGIKYDPRVLLKIKNTVPQEKLSGRNRRKNVVGSFGVAEDYEELIKNKNVLLVDDVLTTGSTVSECAKVLKERGASTVTVATVARVSAAFPAKNATSRI